LKIDRRRWSGAMLGALVLPARARAAAATGGAGRNILRVPLEAAETGFDSVRVSDRYSRTVIAHILEAPYHLDPLAMPVKMRPLTAAALPEVSADFRVWTVQLRPGIFFADDPAFKGARRELVATDYVYAIQRFFDPATLSPGYTTIAEEGVIGLEEKRAAALARRAPFDYDAPAEGLRALDRYTLQIRLREPRPRFLETCLCDSGAYGAVAREVVEFYGADISAHPVGTGPYRLESWRRNSRIVLARNEGFREMLFEAEPAADDAQGQAWAARFKGRRLPFNDGVEISVVEEEQARWLSFLNGEVDFVRVPGTFAPSATPNGVLAPHLAKRGIQARRYVNADFTMSWFNMEDPVVGGYTPERVALRRAIALGYDIDREIHIARRDQAVAAQAPMSPGTFGYDPALRSGANVCDPARAKALLDIYGYLDRDGDGWRERPDGSPLILQMATQGSQIERQLDENWQKSMAAIGLRIEFKVAQWAENLKAAHAGKLAMWALASTATTPDGQQALAYMYGPGSGSSNLARFKLPAFDAIYERLSLLPNGPQRQALFIEASKLIAAYMPYRMHVHRIYTDLNHPWLTGYRQGLFRSEGWQYVEVDGALRDRRTIGA
jgi:ABC-type transport system substrate-binding protein